MKNLYYIIIILAFSSGAFAQSNSGRNDSRSDDFINQSGSSEIRLKDYHVLWVFNDVGNHNTNRNGISDNTITENVASTVETSLYPVPANDHLNFSFTTDITSGTIIIFDAGGKLILNHKFSGSETTVASSDFVQGIYFYQVLAESKLVSQGKFYKK